MSQSVKSPLTIALSTAFLLGSCSIITNTKAVEPLATVCEGKTMNNTATLMPKDGISPAVVIYQSESGGSKVRNGFLPAKWRSSKLENTQLVYCVKELPAEKIETCFYQIAGPSVTVERYRNSAQLSLVEAKTGKVLSTGPIQAEAMQCPPSVSVEADRKEAEVRKQYPTKEFNTKIKTWFSENSTKLEVSAADAKPANSSSKPGIGVGQPADPKKQYKAGDAIQIKAEYIDLVIALDGVREHKGLPNISEPAPGERWLVVTVSNRNQHKNSFSASYLNYTLKDSQGNIYKSDVRVTVMDDVQKFPSTIAPGATATGDIGFAVPASAKDLVMVFDIRNEGACKDPTIAKAFYCEVVKIDLE